MDIFNFFVWTSFRGIKGTASNIFLFPLVNLGILKHSVCTVCQGLLKDSGSEVSPQKRLTPCGKRYFYKANE